MYRLLREVHAYCGLLLLLFTVTYAISGFAIVHAGELGIAEPGDEEHTEVPLDYSGDPDDVEALYDYLAAEFGARGNRQPVVHDAGARVLELEGGLRAVRFSVSPDLRSARMTVRESTLLQRSVRLHRMVATRGSLPRIFWGVFVDLVSLAMIVFAVTGVYLWYTRTKDRRLGWILLSGSWTFTLAVSAYLLLI